MLANILRDRLGHLALVRTQDPINTKRQHLDCFRRNEEGLWVLKSYSGEQDKFQLSSINFERKFADLYEGVSF